MKVTPKKDNILANPKNKQRVINTLIHFLQENNCPTYHAEGDADVLIVKTAVESARDRNTVLVGDDTDLLVLLCFYTHSDSLELYFKPEPKAKSRGRVWNVKKIKEHLGDDVCRDLLFIHAILGCDTTSRVHGTGKAAALKKYANSLHFRKQAKVFNSASTVDDIVVAGENVSSSVSTFCRNEIKDRNYNSVQQHIFISFSFSGKKRSALPPPYAQCHFGW